MFFKLFHKTKILKNHLEKKYSIEYFSEKKNQGQQLKQQKGYRNNIPYAYKKHGIATNKT